MSKVESLQKCMPLIKSFGYKVLRRMNAAGCFSVQIEDILQELSIAWHLASQGYKSDSGAQFRTYLFSTMRQHINRWVETELRHTRMTAFSLDDSFGSEEEEGDGHKIVSIEEKNASDFVLEKESKKRVLNIISPRARQFCEFLDNPPMELVCELRGLQSRAKWARSRGIPSLSPKFINNAVVFNFMEASRPERTEILKEVKAAIAKVSK